MTNDTWIPANSESVATAEIVGPGGLGACLIANYLVDGNRRIVPLRVANINEIRVTSKKGQAS